MADPGLRPPERRPPLNAARGLTLIEIMVALAIAAVALASTTVAISQMVDGANGVQQRTYASWIAHNRIAELRLANVVPDVSTTTGELVYAGLEWTWEATVSETGVENLFRVDVAVTRVGAENPDALVTGFIGEPVSPGDANTAWTSGGAGQVQEGEII